MVPCLWGYLNLQICYFLFNNHINHYLRKIIIFLLGLCVSQELSKEQNPIHMVQEMANKRLLTGVWRGQREQWGVVRYPGISSGGSHYRPRPEGTRGVTKSIPSVQRKRKSGKPAATGRSNGPEQEGSRKEMSCLLFPLASSWGASLGQTQPRANWEWWCRPQSWSAWLRAARTKAKDRPSGRKWTSHNAHMLTFEITRIIGLKWVHRLPLELQPH